MNPFKSIAHALKMVRRNLKSYLLLSVTIVLSFVLLLGYLCYMDSLHYNRYKGIFAMPRELVTFWGETKAARDTLMCERAKEIGNTDYVLIRSCSAYSIEESGVLETGEAVTDMWGARFIILPRHIPCIYRWEYEGFDHVAQAPITWLDGREHQEIDLKDDEVLVDDQFAKMFRIENGGTLHLSLISNVMEGTKHNLSLNVVGTVPSPAVPEFIYPPAVEEGSAALDQSSGYSPTFYVPSEFENKLDLNGSRMRTEIYFITDSPELVAQMINSFNETRAYGTFQDQDDAKAVMKTENRTKALICGAMLIILGINLYSCFANALNERRFEIGVKRALGASAWSIVRQFLYESLCVMAVNILVSVALVADIFIVYKFIYERTPNEYGQYFQWTIYISPHSIAMFAVCTITLTVVFSLIFAYKSTQVRIADQLKAE